jgi:hypothetical protein
MSLKAFFIDKRRLLYILFCLFLWAYLCIRAISIPLVNDEVLTFFYYINPGNFLPFLAHWDANNHFLNSFLSWISFKTFGNSEFTLRLPNLLFALVYFYFIYRIGSLIKHPFLKWSFLFILPAAHYYLEFFALCRGYGMSIALITAGVWFLFKYFKNNRKIDLVIHLFFLVLAISSNLNLIISFIAIIGLLFLNLFLQRSSVIEKILRSLLVISLGILPVLFFVKYLFVSKTKGLLYTGGSSGFLHDTLKGVTDLLLGNSSTFIIAAIVLFSMITIVYGVNTYKLSLRETLQRPSTLFFILIIANVSASLFLNQFLGMNFTPGRAALFYFLFFTGYLFFVLDDFLKKKKYPFMIGLCLPLFIFPINFFIKMNTSYVDYWKNEQIPMHFYKTAHQFSSDSLQNFPPLISCTQTMKMCWNYCNYTNNGNFSMISCDDFPSKYADFIIAAEIDLPDLSANYDSIDFYDVSKIYLLKRKTQLIHQKIYERTGINTTGIISDEFFNIWQGKADSLVGKSIYCKFDFNLLSSDKPFDAQLVVTVQDSSNNNLKYESLDLSWLRRQWNGKPHNFVNSIFIHDIPRGSSIIKIYIWNIKKAPFSISDGSCYIYNLK